MTTKTSMRMTIFEGVEGSGKTTAAREYARATGARYEHFTALPRVGRNLARMHAEAMLPAVLGYQDVVLDRSWLSDLPYGLVFRDMDRLQIAGRRMLERLAMRCGAVVVHCRPEWETIERNYAARARPAAGRLDQLLTVSALFDRELSHGTQLPVVRYDYEKLAIAGLIGGIPPLRMPQHPLNIESAGNWRAEVMLVGEQFAERDDCDPFYQWPFASFGDLNCDRWLIWQLAAAGIGEHELFWVNADGCSPADMAELARDRPIVAALGAAARDKLRSAGVEGVACTASPQHHKLFNYGEPYPLVEVVASYLAARGDK